MFSLRDLRFLLCPRDLDVLRAQRIMCFFNQRGRKNRSRGLLTQYLLNVLKHLCVSCVR